MLVMEGSLFSLAKVGGVAAGGVGESEGECARCTPGVVGVSGVEAERGEGDLIASCREGTSDRGTGTETEKKSMSGAWHVVFGDSAKAQEVGSSNGGALSSEATVKLVIQFGACAEFQSIGIRKGGVGGKAGNLGACASVAHGIGLMVGERGS